MPRRSRGCAECRQRRIGCDGGVPGCRQCLITNRTCSGPAQSALIIDQTKDVVGRYKHDVVSHKSQPRALVRQPSSAVFTSLAYLAEFMNFLTPSTQSLAGRPWLDGLDDISIDQRGPALDASLKATATVFCGISAKNRAVIMEGCQIYGYALSRQSVAIAKTSGLPNLGTICTTVIMSLFETIWSTGIAAYAAHLLAARRMMSMAILEIAQHQLIRDLGVYIQCQTLFTMIIAPDAYLAAARDHVCDGIARYGLNGMATASDRLFAELFRLGELFLSKNREAAEIRVDLDEVGGILDGIWLDIHVEQSLRGGTWRDGLDEAAYPDPLSAMSSALYAAARMLWHLVRPCSTEELKQDVEANGKTILQCSEYLASQHINCASLRMCFPLSLVALHSTSPQQRRKAHLFVASWLRASPFTGVCAILNQQCGMDSNLEVPGPSTKRTIEADVV